MNPLTHFILWLLKLKRPWTWYSHEECQVLERYVAGKKRPVEIGCWQGVNTARLRKGMAADGVLSAVDPYPKGRLGVNFARIIAKHEVDKVGNGTIQWLRKTDLEAAAWMVKTKQDRPDFIFSDSLNSYDGFKACWEAWSPLLVTGGIYILANSHSNLQDRNHLAGSILFTRDVILKDSAYEHLQSTGSFTVLRKR